MLPSAPLGASAGLGSSQADEEDLWQSRQRNAVQTELPNLLGVLSFASGDLAQAKRIEAYFPTLSLELEQDSVAPPSSTRDGELRIIILSQTYSQLPNAFAAALEAAKDSQLIVFTPYNTESNDEETEDEDDESPLFDERWADLALGHEFTFSGHDAMQRCELFIMRTRAMLEYPAVVQIDDYVVERELGFGAQGVVYLAHRGSSLSSTTGGGLDDNDNGKIQKFAIKEVRNIRTVSDQARNEILVMKRLDHPNVTKLFSVFAPEHHHSLYLVLEYVEGGSFSTDDAVWAGTSPVFEDVFRAQNVFQQLVKGVAYLHRMGVLHRDIKPSNILGHRDHGLVKLADFGVSSFTNTSKSVRLLGEDDVIVVGSSGTPAFLPPEASGASMDSVYNGRAGDVWSLGVTFYVMMVGKLPFRGADRGETARLICTQTAVKFSKQRFPQQSLLHRQCKELIQRMLEKDPARRITLAGVIDHPFLGGLLLVDEDDKLAGFGRDKPSPSVSSGLALSLPRTFSQRVRRRSVTLKKWSRAFFQRLSTTTTTPEPFRRNFSPITTTSSSVAFNKPAQEEEELTLGEKIAKFFEDLGASCAACCGGDRHGDDSQQQPLLPMKEFKEDDYNNYEMQVT